MFTGHNNVAHPVIAEPFHVEKNRFFFKNIESHRRWAV
jgi:hypothetical protein